MCVHTCMCSATYVRVCAWWSEERGESSRFGSLSKSLVTWAQARPQLAPPPTILAFLPLSGAQRVNSNSLLMNWLPKVARQAEQAHLLNTHTHWQQNTQTQIERGERVAPQYISLLSRATAQLILNTCGGSVSLSGLRSCIQDQAELRSDL